MKNKFDRVVVFLNGVVPEAGFLKSLIDERSYIVGCDGGVDIVYQLGLKPHAVVGDFDSAKSLPKLIKKMAAIDKINGDKRIVDDVAYVKYPTERDFTDGEAGLDYSALQNTKEIVIVCGLGGEVDHEMGNLFMIGKAKYDGLNIKFLEPGLEIFIVSGEVQINGQVGQKISLMPIFDKVEVSCCSGLKYDLTKYQMAMETNAGTRNEFTKAQANIKITTGKFLAVIHKK